MKKIILFTGVLVLMSSTIVFSQSAVSTESNPKNENTLKTKIVINEKMVARYQDYVENGTYTSMWETVKDYNMDEMKDFYVAYQAHDFNENTVYADIVKDSQNLKEEQKMKEAPGVKKTERLTASSEIK